MVVASVVLARIDDLIYLQRLGKSKHSTTYEQIMHSMHSIQQTVAFITCLHVYIVNFNKEQLLTKGCGTVNGKFVRFHPIFDLFTEG